MGPPVQKELRMGPGQVTYLSSQPALLCDPRSRVQYFESRVFVEELRNVFVICQLLRLAEETKSCSSV